MKHQVAKSWIVLGIVSMLVFPGVLEKVGYSNVYAESKIAAEMLEVTSSAEIQKELKQQLQARQSTITFKYQGSTANLKRQLKEAIEGALQSDPYTKYIVDRYSYSWKGTSGSAKVTFQVKYRESAAQTAYVEKRVKAIIEQLISPGMSEHQKVKVIHDYVVLHLKYDSKLQKYTAYEGLTSGEAVCQGYSLLMYKLLEEAGIHNMIVEGRAGGQLHAWNLVYLDGFWYHLDATWDDPAPDVPGRVKYSYYLRSDTQMGKTHTWDRKSYPAAEQAYRLTLDSLIKKGGKETAELKELKHDLEYTLFDSGAIVQTAAALQARVKQALVDGKSSVTVRFSGSERQLLNCLRSLYELNVSDIMYLSEPLEDTGDLRVEVHWSRE